MPEMFACFTISGEGGNTRFSWSTVSMLPAMPPPRWNPYARVCSRFFEAPIDEDPERDPRAAAAAEPYFCQPVAAAAVVPRPDRRAGDLRLAVLAGALLPAVRGPGQRDLAQPHPRRRDRRWRAAAAEAQRDGDHAGSARPDRRGDDLQPAHHGDRRRLRDLRLAPGPAEPPRP